MDGLEAVEIRLSEIDLGDRFDADYFLKEYLYVAKRLSNKPTRKLRELSKAVASAFYPAATDLYSIGDTPFVRCVDCVNYPMITQEQDPNFEKIPYKFAVESKGIAFLHKHEIVITKVGTPCYASMVLDYDELALSRTVMGISLINGINPFYLLAFLRSKYGFEQLFRQRELTIQYQLTLERVKDIEVFMPTTIFQNAVQKLLLSYIEMLNLSKQIYSVAEGMLLSHLRLDNYVPNSSGTAVKTLSQSFGASGRLDSEYYQPKYEEIEAAIAKFNPVNISDIIYYPVSSGVTPKAGGDDYTNSDSGIPFVRAVDIVNSEVDLSNCNFIKPCVHTGILKRTQLEKNDVLFSIAGTVGRCGIFTHNVKANINQAVAILRFEETVVKRLYLICYFNSNIGKTYVEKYARQGLQTNLNLQEVSQLKIPVLSMDKQNEIADKIQESFALRKKSAELLELAKTAVEVAIEQGEEKAMMLLEEMV